MTEKEAIDRAIDFVRAESLDVGPVIKAWYLSQSWLSEREGECPKDLLDTYRSVLPGFQDHWVITFELARVPGEVRCPSTREICVYEKGDSPRSL